MIRYCLIVYYWNSDKSNTELLVVLELSEFQRDKNKILDDYAKHFDFDRKRISGSVSRIINANFSQE